MCAIRGWKCATEIGKDDEWGEIKHIGIFGGGVYLLDSGKGKIWKYPATENGFGKKKEWTGGVEGGTSMAIDGSIWLMSGTELRKYTSGERETFEVTGPDKNWGGRAQAYTAWGLENLYILDGENKRVVILKKNGEYIGQMVSDKLEHATSMVADEAGKKIFWVARSQVWEAGM